MPIINETIISGVNAKDATATGADILQGKTAVVGKELITGTMPEKSGQTVNGTFVSGTTGYITGKISQEGHYTTNSRLKIPVTNLAAGNIKKGVNIGGVTGTLSPTNVITQVGINSFTLNIEVPSTSSSFGGYLKMGTCSGSGTWIFINSGQSKSFSITGGPSFYIELTSKPWITSRSLSGGILVSQLQSANWGVGGVATSSTVKLIVTTSS